MFFANSSTKQLFKDAKTLLHLSHKVVRFRKDLLSEKSLQDIAQRQSFLVQSLKDKDVKKVESGWDDLHKVLVTHGGKIYPVTGWSDNIELFIFAALVIIGLRVYFVQPFKIPTNSMYPTYGGMVPEVYTPDNPRPSLPVGVFNKFRWFASARTLEAPRDGELWVPISLNNNFAVFAESAQDKLLGVIPRPARQFTFAVGGEQVQVKVPLDFDMQWVLRDILAPQAQNFQEFAQDLFRQNRFSTSGQPGILWLHTGLQLKEGEPFLDFDIITGDMLLVDRFSYHFWSPQVGDPFVFRTRGIPSFIKDALENKKPLDDRYYIKRLVGVPGDEISVRPPVLYRNGKPIEGCVAFEKNNRALGEYEGYTYLDMMQAGDKISIPALNYYAMGDNSDNSGDSRQFGFVPADQVVGKPFLIYYPFTSRWGWAK